MSKAASHSEPEVPWQRDTFLERCLGFPVFRLRDPGAARAAIAAADAHEEWMIEARIPVGQPAQAAALARSGFRIADTNLQLVRVARAGAAPAGCRLARPDDEPAVRAIAATAFSLTRFHLDPRISAAAANRVKEEWVANYFRAQRGDWLVVAEDDRGVCGFNLLLHGPGDSLIIDLIAVAERSRQHGVGSDLIESAAGACLVHPANMTVGTQVANFASLALYTRLGFRPAAGTYVYHLHRADVIR